MDKNNLSFSMSQSITEECSELVSSIAEVTLDFVLEDGLLKDIPSQQVQFLFINQELPYENDMKY